MNTDTDRAMNAAPLTALGRDELLRFVTTLREQLRVALNDVHALNENLSRVQTRCTDQENELRMYRSKQGDVD